MITPKPDDHQSARPPLGNRAGRRTFATKLKAASEARATTYGLAVRTVWRLLKEVDSTMRRTGPAPARKGR
ncbi:hypothetical protein [Amycolatopsis sp. NBC_01480]|uniref:hypothetical protein n=1 Tax=Amycolatopsis sp. NBC_01480 TaxID=2903562 RepID=UPI002E283D40|nr:hypothetical protein [Amycolatopsis sp. NBC_01480]